MNSNISRLSDAAIEKKAQKRMGIAVQRTALLVLGMHRSGTSATTRVMSLLGADLPSKLMLPKAGNNEAGFWESLDIYQLNDEILASAGSSWDDWRPFNPDWLRSPISRDYLQRALDILQREFGASALFVLKDPRMCRLLPFWLEVFREFGADVKCVLSLRNPLEVAASLKERDAFSPAKSYMLWLRHVLDAEKATRKLSRVLVGYDDLLYDWRRVTKRLSRGLEIRWPRKSDVSAIEIERFLNERHRHHRIDSKEISRHSDVVRWVKVTSKALEDLVDNPKAKKPKARLDRVRKEFNRASEALGAIVLAEEMERTWLREQVDVLSQATDSLKSDLEKKLALVGDKDRQISQQEGTIEQLHATVDEREKRIGDWERRAHDQGQQVNRRDGRIADLERQNADQASSLNQLDRQLSERDQVVTESNLRIEQLQAELTQASGEIENTREKLARSEQQAREREEEAHRLNLALSERSESHTRLETLVRQQEQTIDALRSLVKERKDQCDRLDETQKQTSLRLNSLESQLEQKDKAIHSLQANVSAEQSRVSKLKHEVSGLKREADRLDGKRMEVEAQRDGSLKEIRRVREKITSLSGDLNRERRQKELVRTRRLQTLSELNLTLVRLNALQVTESMGFWGRVKPETSRLGSSAIASRRRLPPRLLCGRELDRQTRRRLRQQANELLDHGLFDVQWYVESNPRVVWDGVDPVWHWLVEGWHQGLSPHPLFDVSWYLETYPDVRDSGMNPVRHFIRYGASERRDPHPLFDTDWYLQQNPGLIDTGENPLGNYLAAGAVRSGSPTPLFDSSWYLERNTDVAEAGVDPLLHFLKSGIREGRDPHVLFQSTWYLQQNPDIAEGDMAPFDHYLRHGWRELRNPNALFDVAWYLEVYPDVADSGINPLLHYLKHGHDEGRDPNPLFDTDWYLQQNPDLKAGGVNALAHYLCCGGNEQRDPGPKFNTGYYLKSHPEIVDACINPLVHFLAGGDIESRLAEILPNFERFRGAGDVIGQPGSVQLQPSERFVIDPSSFNPSVAVVVPNYNHAGYLERRLDSVYSQTYSNFNVILLDDCSTDDSRTVLARYAKRYPEKTTVLFNEENSGGVFNQWRRGIEQADADLVWIAESDDFCDPNFLEELVPYFVDEAVMLAYSHSVFVDENGNRMAFGFEGYLGDLSADRWSSNFVNTAHNEVNGYLGIKNTIPNVSAVVFRKPVDMPLLRDSAWLSMKICGDWIFYLHLLKGGKVAYSKDTHNYFRFHSSNSSAKTYSRPDYYREHEMVACEVARNFAVAQDVLVANRSHIEKFYADNAGELIADDHELDEFFALSRVWQSAASRKPNILMAVFALSTGGGEVFPIRLANYLKRQGFPITFFNFMGDAFNPHMRRMLRPDIPLIERNEWCPSVEELFEEYGFDVVHTHHASVDTYFGSHAGKARHVVTMHGMYEAMSKDIFDLTLEKLATNVDEWVYIAEKNLTPFKAMKRGVSGAFTKIPNGMERPTIQPLNRTEYGVPEDAFLVCLASRAIPEKGWRVAMDMVGGARSESGRDIHLLLLGDGPVRDELESENLPNYVHLLGFRENVVDFYAMSDLGLLPTTFAGESFPLSIIECFMAGRPIMVTEVGEVRNMLTLADGQLGGILIDSSTGRLNLSRATSSLASLVNKSTRYHELRETACLLADKFDMKVVGDYYVSSYLGEDK